MTLIPRHRALRVLAALWLLAAAVMLVATLLRPELQSDARRALSGLVPLYFMSLPLGHAGLAAVIRLKVDLYVIDEYVPAILVEGVVLWTALTVLGYVQWFVLLPLAARGLRRWGRAYSARRAAVK